MSATGPRAADLPPGQHAIDAFPRFGLLRFARRFPDPRHPIEIVVGGDVAVSFTATATDLRELPRVETCADFHCVTTWTRRGVRWSGFRFRDFHERLVCVRARPAAEATLVVLRGRDGYSTSLPLADLLVEDVLLADRLDDAPLGLEHGAPLRLVAPAHYGYKNAKHLRAIEFWRDARNYRSSAPPFMDHPRARVALEERGRGVPGWLLRWLYRPLAAPTMAWFRRALRRHHGGDPR